MNLEAILAGVGAILTAAGGVAVIIRELRRRDRLALTRTIDEMSTELNTTRADFLAFRSFAYGLAQMLADHGVEPPAPPTPHGLAPKS